MMLLAFAEAQAEAEIEERPRTLVTRGTNGVMYLMVEPAEFRWVVTKSAHDYKSEVITEAGTEKGNPVVLHQGRETRAWVEVPKRAGPFSFSLVMSSGPKPMEIPARPLEKAKAFGAGGERRRMSGDAHFQIEHFPLPPEAELMVTGMDWLNERDLAVCTWLGEIYIIENATGPVEGARYRRFARGLNEPLGLTTAKEHIYVVQKGELTRVADMDKDGGADWFECINDDWGYSGNYHSYSFGPLVTPENEFMVFITGQRGRSDLPFQGSAIRVDHERLAWPFCHGLRVPHGWGTYESDIFVTDNQGNWIGACRLNHLQEGKFYGFQLEGMAKKNPRRAEDVELPVLWFPRSLAPSTSGIETITTDQFGPFKGQMLIGDFQNSIVMRASLEKVRGKWQGAVFPFAKGFLSGVNRLKMGADGKLYVGGGKRTWSTAAPKEFSLDRVSYAGKVPFEVQEVRATKNGFELRFTQPLEAAPAKDPENYLVKQFSYKYHADYGSPEFDHDGKIGATETAVEKVELSEDRKIVQLTIPSLKTGFVTSFQLAINNEDDDDLRNDSFFYTLNQQPD
jgi:glucose/arabinose dehydrogenase